MPGPTPDGHKYPRKPSAKDAGRLPDGKAKPHTPDEKTRGMVEAMAAMGMSVNEIAVQLDLRPGQINEHYGRELVTASGRANLAVARAMFEKAKAGDMTAAKFWLQNRAGWREKQDVQVGLSLEQLVSESMSKPQPQGDA